MAADQLTTPTRHLHLTGVELHGTLIQLAPLLRHFLPPCSQLDLAPGSFLLHFSTMLAYIFPEPRQLISEALQQLFMRRVRFVLRLQSSSHHIQCSPFVPRRQTLHELYFRATFCIVFSYLSAWDDCAATFAATLTARLLTLVSAVLRFLLSPVGLMLLRHVPHILQDPLSVDLLSSFGIWCLKGKDMVKGRSRMM